VEQAFRPAVRLQSDGAALAAEVLQNETPQHHFLSLLLHQWAFTTYHEPTLKTITMAISNRGITGHDTYFITTSCAGKRPIFQTGRMALLMVDVLFHYSAQHNYALHEFVIMPDHLHLLITPAITLERAMQMIKGGFSFRAKKELGFNGEIWETSFHDRRVRDAREYHRFRQYIWENPVGRGLCPQPTDYAYSSATSTFALDEVPQRLKPLSAATPQA
jgi:REP-associated tyrosine transposase